MRKKRNLGNNNKKETKFVKNSYQTKLIIILFTICNLDYLYSRVYGFLDCYIVHTIDDKRHCIIV